VDPVGVGLAAPQVGVGQRLFVIKPTPKSKPQVFINPEIISIDTNVKIEDEKLANDENSEALEGCLSIPRISEVLRS
jgi:peptide deformylase